MPGLLGWIGWIVGALCGAWLVSFPLGGERLDRWYEYLGVLAIAWVFEYVAWPRLFGFGWPWPDRGDPAVHGWAVSGWRWVGRRGK